MTTRPLATLLLAAGLTAALPAYATTTQDRVVAELREQGFTRIEISRTLLGRTRIRATSDTAEREIVLNPSTGVILRDFWTAQEDGGESAGIIGAPNVRDGGSRGSGSSRDDDDDTDSGSSGSGSGSGGSGGSESDDDSRDDNSGSGSGGSDRDDRDDDSRDDSDRDTSGSGGSGGGDRDDDRDDD